MGYRIDGILASECIDSSGEIIDIAGCDTSSIQRGEGVVNFEHESKSPLVLLGKILESKKIFNEGDCENDRQKYFWSKCKCPYIYILCELFDSDVCKHVEAMFDYAEKTGNSVLGYSIEGNKISKEGLKIMASVARKATLTVIPCNKTCIAEKFPIEQESSPDTDSIFKSEPIASIDLYKAEPKWSEGKQIKEAVHFSHPEHGTVSIHKNPTGEFHVKHNGAMAGLRGQKGSFKTPTEAGTHARKYMEAVSQKKILPQKMHDRSSPQMVNKKSEDMNKGGEKSPGLLDIKQKGTFEQKGVHKPPLNQAGGGESVMGSHVRNPSDKGSGSKEMARRHAQSTLKEIKQIKPNLPKSEDMNKALSAGSSMASPGTLTQGAALGKESLESKKQNVTLKKQKSMSLIRAEQEYQNWNKREAFESFMSKRMPHLTKGEIQAIGQTIALQKALKAEKKLAKEMVTGSPINSFVQKKEND